MTKFNSSTPTAAHVSHFGDRGSHGSRAGTVERSGSAAPYSRRDVVLLSHADPS